MADLLTYYDDDEANTFIDCVICDKRIRGECQYKIHLTTLQHVKKEEALADQGILPRPHPLPEWTDIKEYLQYLNLDEPIIGLSTLVQVEDFVSEDGKTLLKYRCRMCGVEMDICSMASHVVGRKHRQKYLQLKRPDLVTWQDNSQKQPGLVAKAKAAVVEKQEGWGDPVPLNRRSSGRSLNVPAQGHDLGIHDMELSDKYRPLTRQSRYRQGDEYDGSYRGGDTSYPDEDRSRASYSPDGRQRETYRDERATGRSYVREELNSKYFPDEGENSGGRFDERWENRYPERNSSRGQYSSRDSSEDFYRGGAGENRCADTQQCVGDAGWRSSGTEKEGRHDRLYMSSEEQGLGMGEMQGRGRNFWYAERGRQESQEFTRAASSGSYESQGYTERYRDLLEEDVVPEKRKRKSRFSDVSAEEMVLARKCQIETLLRDEWKKMERVRKPPQAFEKRAKMDMRQTAPSKSSVLDVLNDIRIESADDASFLKEKLCSLLQEFNAKKAHQTEQKTNVLKRIRDYSHINSNNMELARGLQETGLMDDQGFKESARYEHSPRSYMSSQEAQRFEESPRGFQETRRFDEDRRNFQNVGRYEKDTFQESARYKSEPIDFQGRRSFEDRSAGFNQDRRYEDRDFDCRRHFEDHASDFQQAGSSNEGHRDFQEARYDQETRSFQSMRHQRGTEDRGYEEYERGESSQSAVAREAVKGRYPEDDFRCAQGSLKNEREFEWSRSRGASAEAKSYYPDGNRDLRENPWNSTSVRGEERLYTENQTPAKHFHRNYHSGSEPYDPYNPSTSPPREMPTNSSLEKLASTLLELVASKST